MRIKLLVLILLIFCCGSDIKYQYEEAKEVLPNVMTIELAFGAEEERGEFLLARPGGHSIGVNYANDIFIVDENRVKVFDANGNSKTIIGSGRPGLGPGEFMNVSSLWIAPSGYLAVVGSFYAHFFRPDHEFIEKMNLRANPRITNLLRKSGLKLNRHRYIAAINETDRLMMFETQKMGSQNSDHYEDFIVLTRPDTMITIAQYKKTDAITIPNGKMGSFNQLLGKLYYDLLPENRVMYTHTGYDTKTNEQVPTYTLHIQSMETHEKTEITINYAPLEITEDPAAQFKEMISAEGISKEAEKDIKDMIESVERRFKNVSYKPPLQGILTDGMFVFAFTFRVNENNEILTHIINAQTKIHLSTGYFPFIPQVIKNGYAYRTNTNKEGFYIVEKYKIDTAVYGK